MHLPQRLRLYGAPVLASVIIFFHFLGHLWLDFVGFLLGKITISWHGLLNTVYRSGVTLLVPLLLLSSLLGSSIVLNIYHILSPYDLEHNVILISQQVLFYDLLPFLIALMLSVQSALNLINAKIRKLKLTPHEVLVIYIIPMIFGMSFSALLLYIYSIIVVYVSIYFCFRFLLSTDINEYLFHLTNTLTNYSIIYSLFKVLIYCILVSLIVGYYYYQVAAEHLLIRKAMSRIITRSFVWLAISSIYFELLAH